MTTVSFTMMDFGFDVPPASRVVFTPRAAAQGTAGRLISASPVYAYANSLGAGSVDLFDVAALLEPVDVLVGLEHLVDGHYMPWRDFPGWIIRPTGPSGLITDFIVQAPAVVSGLIWVGPTPPPDPSGYVGWIDTSSPGPSGMPYYEWEA